MSEQVEVNSPLGEDPIVPDPNVIKIDELPKIELNLNTMDNNDPLGFHNKPDGPGHHMSEDEIINFLQKFGGSQETLNIDDIVGFDHQQLDDYLLKTSLSEAQKHKIKHQIFHLKHKGHEAMHTEMVLVMITLLVIGQILLVQWKKKSPKTYNLVTLLLLWLTPFLASIYYGWKRFICIWFIFSIIVGLPIRKAVWKTRGTNGKLSVDTPRLVYRVFLFMFRISLGVGTIGYLCFIFTMLGLNLTLFISPDTAFDFSFLCLWYGFYFGVVVRDFSDLCATSIAVKGKFYKEDYNEENKKYKKLPERALDKNTCALCANKLNTNTTIIDGTNLNQITNNSNDTRLTNINLEDFNNQAYGINQDRLTQQREPNTSDDEKTIRISCGHEFHEYCIRGWVILGKQSTCPYCNEKVDTKILGNHPWEKYNRMYATLLEWLRYLVAWQPIILLIINGVTHIMGLE